MILSHELLKNDSNLIRRTMKDRNKEDIDKFKLFYKLPERVETFDECEALMRSFELRPLVPKNQKSVKNLNQKSVDIYFNFATNDKGELTELNIELKSLDALNIQKQEADDKVYAFMVFLANPSSNNTIEIYTSRILSVTSAETEISLPEENISSLEVNVSSEFSSTSLEFKKHLCSSFTELLLSLEESSKIKDTVDLNESSGFSLSVILAIFIIICIILLVVYLIFRRTYKKDEEVI